MEKSLGLVILKLRREKGFSQEYLATMAGLSTRYLIDIERGRRNLSINVANRIAKELNTSLSNLVAKAEKLTA